MPLISESVKKIQRYRFEISRVKYDQNTIKMLVGAHFKTAVGRVTESTR